MSNPELLGTFGVLFGATGDFTSLREAMDGGPSDNVTTDEDLGDAQQSKQPSSESEIKEEAEAVALAADAVSEAVGGADDVSDPLEHAEASAAILTG